MNFTFPIDHIGIAVKNLADAEKNYLEKFGGHVSFRETLVDRNLEIIFIDTGNTLIELLSPTEFGVKDPNNTVNKFLTNKGEGLHHICYKVEDLEQELARMSKMGIRLIDSVPRHGAFNSKIAFLHPKDFSGVLVELCERN
jgi:methylmalonyl-CoA/ethylmalonyl-CoA epimerase